MKTKKVKKKRLNVARTLVFILFIYLVVCICLYMYKEPVRHYKITGNNLVSDVEILRSLNLHTYPSYVSINPRVLEKKLKNNPFINDVDIKYGLNFVIKINVTENIPVFILKSTNEVVLSNNKRVENDGSFIGLPILLNSTPEDVMKILSKELSLVDPGIRYLINEIEYTPSYNEYGKAIDDKKFLLSMNDKNMVYITAKKTTTLNKYLDIISNQRITGRGTLFLDGNERRYPFKHAPTEVVEEKETEGDEVEE